MMMPLESEWKRNYRILKEYVGSNPDIHLDPCEICIPEAFRNGFYKYFDDVRRAFVESWISSFACDVHALSKNFIASENALNETSKLSISLEQDLSSFLRTPKEGIMRLIYNRLFELIQGKIAEADFEKIAEGDLATEATAMFRIGYETWAALSLILQLEPEGFLGVAFDNDNKPMVAEIKEIAFGRQFHHPAKRIPEFIFHSKKLDRYVAFKMPLAREVNSYYVPVELSTQKLLRNRNGDSSSVLDHRTIFLSSIKDLKEIPVFVDIHERTVNGPDLSIECIMEQDLSDSAIIGQIQNRMEIMKPRIGGAMVLMDSKYEPSKIAGNIDTVSVGLDPSGFQLVIEKLV
jgi:hypothetical protein